MAGMGPKGATTLMAGMGGKLPLGRLGTLRLGQHR